MLNKSQLVLPINLEIKIPKNDFVFKMLEICSELDYTKLLKTYARKWRKVNPITIFELLVIWIYVRKIFFTRNRKCV